MNERLWAFRVPWSPDFVLGRPPRGGVFEIIQVITKHDPFDAMQGSMWTLHLSCIHIFRWSLKRSVKRTWTGSACSTNESAWSVMVTGSQSRVWNGPKAFPRVCIYIYIYNMANTLTPWLLVGARARFNVLASLAGAMKPFMCGPSFGFTPCSEHNKDAEGND